MSDLPRDGGPVTYHHWVADCLAVLDASGSKRAVVFGHEHGGPAAVRLACRAPTRVAGLALHTVLSAPEDGNGAALAATERMIEAGPNATVDLLAATAPSARADPALGAWLERAGQLGATPSRAKHLHRLYRVEDIRPLLPRVTAPAIVLHAVRNRIYDVAHARALAQRLPHAELILLDSADHLFWLQDAPAVGAALVRLADRAATGSAQRPVLAAIVSVITSTPEAAASAARAAGAWSTRIAAPDTVLGAFSSTTAAIEAATDAAVRRGCRSAVHIVEVDASLDHPVLTRCVADARSSAAGTVTVAASVQTVLDGPQ